MDTGWRQWRVGAEYDGLIAHGSREQLRSDRRRANQLTGTRWTLLHVTDHDVYRRPAEMVITVTRAFGLHHR
ncbi:hypothetical protein [Modestobacter sp. VKM Ac-2985]|uniref:hypothetical protein n=1 Tax=Modestobacter sp. VKM Ac-2985 TaxID=3004139 RepID=UPI0022AB800C|nr:hypothetical protein [Modestobacter sp. VKM Ac-2985]MCZ2838065.1 hypothetical protein [Modestobacter sp. VKM Ac-2985]